MKVLIEGWIGMAVLKNVIKILMLLWTNYFTLS
jgi:hypothetical protein